jgi:seryl-tRNA synthetase
MEQKQLVSNAIKELEKEKQEKEIAKIKDIVRAILEKIEGKEKEVKAKQEELRALKADLDDLKAGRLDKIKERQDNDPVHQRNSVVEIHILENFNPYQPWRNTYAVTYLDPFMSATSTANGSCTAWAGTTTVAGAGTTWQNFTSGTYILGNGRIINL